MTVGQDLISLCLTSDVTEDTPVHAEINGEQVAIFQVGDNYYVTQNLCTHGPGLLADGFVEGDEIECPFHQGKFNILTGLPTAAPCTIPLRTWAVEIRDGHVCVPAVPRESGES